ncbi:hypothetical protein NCAS_0I00260 [Naumovozyma castellii]|uniref:Dienelactone hydrolase domain-containing protein n=1 Tax=Naumovozyma castellii TaxID=27288 RepID=G0VJL4_NAUCA|nr:hypothetical protein NCAS_0I00260 [Naumovozyma castellii CBS 4309]CCC71694.1 hypothetical protein NCAS_0I00260 [Naumovozyma castellii CBS 4309]
MASNRPGKCCFSGFYHEGTPKGIHESIYGVDTYVTGSASPKEKVIVILTDVYGNRFNNVNLIADQLADAGYKVYIPDILFNDPVVALDGSVDFNEWLAKHDAVKTRAVVDNFLKELKREFGPKFIGVIGYCFGAKFAVQQISSKDGLANCCAIAHPSFVSIDEIKAIGNKKPLLISAAENDTIFPADLRHTTEDTLREIGARYQLDLFSGVSHGFAARGDVSDPVVKYAKEKALRDQIFWFDHFST